MNIYIGYEVADGGGAREGGINQTSRTRAAKAGSSLRDLRKRAVINIKGTDINLDSITIGEAAHVTLGKEPIGKQREEDEFR